MSVDVGENENAGGDTETRGEVGEKCWHMMTAYAKEFCFVLTVIFTAYAALQNSSLKTQKVGIPKRFFPWNSLVTDYYMGTIDLAFERISESDMTFVMYYAPWDAVSMEARWEFDKVSKFYHHKVQFLAINCWWMEGACRRHFRRIHSYPILMAYPGVGRGVQFRGPYLLPHMFRFLEKILRPVHPIYDLDDIINLQARYDTVVIGYFDFEISPHPPGFIAYYNTAMKALENDPGDGVCFAVVSKKKLAAVIGLKESKSFVLLRFNASINASHKSKSDSLLTWTFKERQPTAQWLNLPRTKSIMLSNVLEKSNPALILFTPQNPMIDSNPYFNLLNEVAMDYYNCNKTIQVQQIIDRSVLLRKKENIFYSSCNSFFPSINPWTLNRNFLSSPKCCYSLKSITNRVCDVCLVHDVVCHDLLSTLPKMDSLSDVCKETYLNYNPWNVIVWCCREKSNIQIDDETNNFLSSVIDDDRVALSLQEREEFNCYKHRASKLYDKFRSPVENVPYSDSNFSGLGCRTNRSLNFVAIDSLQYDDLTTNLGFNLSQFHQRTAILIHHTQQEIQHILRDLVTKRSLVEFISNFTDNHLRRHLREVVKHEESICNKNQVCVSEVTQSTFSSTVLNTENDVVLFYYAPWCGFCSGVYHIYIEVADYFKSVPQIVFARINGDKNDLPWEFTASKYPTILYFPGGRKTESRLFPEKLPITFSNLVSFVLENTGRYNRLLIASKLCFNKNCVNKNRWRILSHIQRLIGDIRTLSSRIYQVDIALLRTDKANKSSLTEYKHNLQTQLKRTKVQLKQSKKLSLIINSARIDEDQINDVFELS